MQQRCIAPVKPFPEHFFLTQSALMFQTSCWAELCSDSWFMAFILNLLTVGVHIQVLDYI